MSINSRRKGMDFEQGIARILQCIWPGAKRGIGQARMANECPDVIGTDYWVECKRMRKVCISAAYKQGQEATDGRPVLVISKENRGKVLVTMALEDWLGVVKRP